MIAGVLNDERSWRGTRPVGGSSWSGDGERAELHAYIVTPGTTDRLCAPLLTRGEVSCQNGNRVVLNAKRWLLGADAYGSDLTNYRRYLVNHEFGPLPRLRPRRVPGSRRAGAGDDAADQGTGRLPEEPVGAVRQRLGGRGAVPLRRLRLRPIPPAEVRSLLAGTAVADDAGGLASGVPAGATRSRA